MTNKTAMILAAGRGERMRPLTDAVPKPLLEVNGKPLIEYHLESLKKCGYTRIVINHAWLGEQIEDTLGAGQRFGLDILYCAETQALETAGGIINALPLLCPNSEDEIFTVVNGDIFTDFDFRGLPSFIPKEFDAHLVMVDNPSHNPQGDFCFMDPSLHPDNGIKLTFSGIAVYRKTFFKQQHKTVHPLSPMLRKGIESGIVSAQHFTGDWTDVGTPQRLIDLNSRSI